MSTPGGGSDGGTQELVTVRLVGFPLAVHLRAVQQSDAMRREFQLIVLQEREHAGSVPARLLSLSTVLASRYEGFSEQQEQLIEDSSSAGRTQLDELVFVLPRDVSEAAQQLGDILDEADAFCRSGHLLTLATPPDLVTYRRWYLDNFIAQCDGGPPQPWIDTRLAGPAEQHPVAPSSAGPGDTG